MLLHMGWGGWLRCIPKVLICRQPALCRQVCPGLLAKTWAFRPAELLQSCWVLLLFLLTVVLDRNAMLRLESGRPGK